MCSYFKNGLGRKNKGIGDSKYTNLTNTGGNEAVVGGFPAVDVAWELAGGNLRCPRCVRSCGRGVGGCGLELVRSAGPPM